MSAHRHPPDDEDDPLDENAIEESLNEALNDLEQMLERREAGRDGEDAPGAHTRHGAADRPHEAAVDDTDEGEQYRIPLLDEVVIPGTDVPPRPGAQPAGDGAAFAAEDEPAIRRRLAARLASEVEVIVQDRIEAALDEAREEIRERVRNHIDIILPEIVEELLQTRSRRDD